MLHDRKLDDELRHKAIDLAALYEHRLQARSLVCVLPQGSWLHPLCYSLACDNSCLACVQEGSKAIFHLEGFVARFMSEYKTWSIMMLGS